MPVGSLRSTLDSGRLLRARDGNHMGGGVEGWKSPSGVQVGAETGLCAQHLAESVPTIC